MTVSSVEDIYTSIPPARRSTADSRPLISPYGLVRTSEEQYVQPPRHTTCCCCNPRLCAALLLLFALTGLIIRYTLHSSDEEIRITMRLLGVEAVYDVAAVRMGVLVWQCLNLFLLFLSILGRNPYFLYPYMITQWLLISAQCALVCIFLILGSLNRLQSMENNIQTTLDQYVPADVLANINGAGSVVLGLYMSFFMLVAMLVNLIVLTILKRYHSYCASILLHAANRDFNYYA